MIQLERKGYFENTFQSTNGFEIDLFMGLLDHLSPHDRYANCFNWIRHVSIGGSLHQKLDV